MFSQNVSRALSTQLSSDLNIPLTNSLDSYLGFPILNQRKYVCQIQKCC